MPDFDQRVLNDKRFKEIKNDSTFLNFNRYLEEQEESQRQAELKAQAGQQEQAQKQKLDNRIAEIEEEEHEQNILNVDDVRVDAMNIRGEDVLAKRYAKMKKTVRDTEPEGLEGMDFDSALEWAMSSAMVDGASDTFMGLVKKMASFKDQISQVERDYAVKATDSKLQKELKARYISGKKQNLIFEVNNLAEVYLIKVRGHKFTKKGKARETLAKNIVSIMTGMNRTGFERTEVLDDSSMYFHDQIARMNSNASVTLQKQDIDENSGYRMLCDRFNIHERHQERCYYDWTNDNFAEREKDRKQVNKAMDAYARHDDAEPMYAVMDKRLKQFMEFTISDSFFDREWVAKNYAKVLEFHAMSQRDADLFASTSQVIGPISAGYMERMKNADRPFFELVCKKGRSISYAWAQYQQWIEMNLGVRVGSTMNHSIDYKNADVDEFTSQWRLDSDDEGFANISSVKGLMNTMEDTADPTNNIPITKADMRKILTTKYTSKEFANPSPENLGWEVVQPRNAHQAAN